MVMNSINPTKINMSRRMNRPNTQLLFKFQTTSNNNNNNNKQSERLIKPPKKTMIRIFNCNFDLNFDESFIFVVGFSLSIHCFCWWRGRRFEEVNQNRPRISFMHDDHKGDDDNDTATMAMISIFKRKIFIAQPNREMCHIQIISRPHSLNHSFIARGHNEGCIRQVECCCWCVAY